MGKAARKIKAPKSTPVAAETVAVEAIESDKPALVSIPHGMDFRIGQLELQRALQRMQTVVDRKSCLPMLAHVALRAHGKDSLTLIGTDLNVSLTITLPSANAGTGGTTIAARKLLEIVKTLPSGELAMHAKPRGAVIQTGRVKASLDGIPDRDFPKVPVCKAESVTVPASILVEMIEATSYSVCQDETRFHLNGALLECDGTMARMVTTDGHRLTSTRRAFAGPKIAKGILIPRKGLSEIVRLLTDEPCQIAIDGHHMFVTQGNATLSVKLIDAQFPPYEQVIPTGNRNLVTVDRGELVEAVTRARMICTETRGLKLTADPGLGLIVQSDNPDLGEMREEIPTEYHGKLCSIGFNPVYVLETLARMTGDRVTIALGANELDPGLFRSTDDATMRAIGDAEYLSVIMPMRI